MKNLRLSSVSEEDGVGVNGLDHDPTKTSLLLNLIRRKNERSTVRVSDSKSDYGEQRSTIDV